MANSTQITVLNSASATATVSTLDGFRDGVGTAALVIGNVTATLLNATVTGTLLNTINNSITGATVTVGTAGAASTSVITVQGIASMTPILTSPSAATSGGLLKSSTIGTATNNTTLVKSGAGQVYHIAATNSTATIAYLKFYDATTAIAGSGTPVWRVAIPGSSSGGGGIVEEITNGLVFSNGIAFVTTGGITDADTSVVTAGALLINVGYK